MLHPRIINDLCRYPMWLVDGISFGQQPGTVIIGGWALAPDGDLMIGEISLNGSHPDLFQRVPSPDLVNHFPWHANAEMSRYRATFHNVDMNADLLQFSYAGRWTGDPFNRWQDVFFPVRSWREKTYIEPDAARMVRTQGNDAFVRYVMYGTTIANTMNNATLTYFGKHLSEFSNICDWGCGCARVIQAIHQMAPATNLTGLDIDSDNIDWCRDSIRYATFATVPLLPPTQIPDGQFDLLYGISVFTHLTRTAFDAWCDELRRIVCPGGTVLVTINRGAALVRTGHEGLITRTLNSGFDDAGIDHALDGKIADPQYYRSTYLSTSEAMRIFGSRFRVRDILRQASGTSQDIVVCERPR